MTYLIKLVSFISVAVFLGLFSAQLILDGRVKLFTHTSGAWKSWPAAGTQEADPYTKAHFLARYHMVPSRFEAVEFVAKTDDAGQPLDGNCTYQLHGKMPVARWWSLASQPASSDVTANEPGITSYDALYDDQSDLKVTVSRDVHTGNWLRPASADEFVLIMRIYGAAAAKSDKGYRGALLSILRESCR